MAIVFPFIHTLNNVNNAALYMGWEMVCYDNMLFVWKLFGSQQQRV